MPLGKQVFILFIFEYHFKNLKFKQLAQLCLKYSHFFHYRHLPPPLKWLYFENFVGPGANLSFFTSLVLAKESGRPLRDHHHQFSSAHSATDVKQEKEKEEEEE